MLLGPISPQSGSNCFTRARFKASSNLSWPSNEPLLKTQNYDSRFVESANGLMNWFCDISIREREQYVQQLAQITSDVIKREFLQRFPHSYAGAGAGTTTKRNNSGSVGTFYFLIIFFLQFKIEFDQISKQTLSIFPQIRSNRLFNLLEKLKLRPATTRSYCRTTIDQWWWSKRYFIWRQILY